MFLPFCPDTKLEPWIVPAETPITPSKKSPWSIKTSRMPSVYVIINKLFEGCDIETGVDYLEHREHYDALGETVVYT